MFLWVCSSMPLNTNAGTTKTMHSATNEFLCNVIMKELAFFYSYQEDVSN